MVIVEAPPPLKFEYECTGLKNLHVENCRNELLLLAAFLEKRKLNIFCGNSWSAGTPFLFPLYVTYTAGHCLWATCLYPKASCCKGEPTFFLGEWCCHDTAPNFTFCWGWRVLALQFGCLFNRNNECACSDDHRNGICARR